MFWFPLALLAFRFRKLCLDLDPLGFNLFSLGYLYLQDAIFEGGGNLLTVQVDGTSGSAVATLRKCFIQPGAATPRPVWNPDMENPVSFFDDWLEVPDTETYENAFKIQWELFLKSVVSNTPFEWDLTVICYPFCKMTPKTPEAEK